MKEIDKLKEITNTLKFSHLISTPREAQPSISDLEMVQGEGILCGIVNAPGYSIGEANILKGSMFASHIHDQTEVLVMCRGHAIIHIGNRDVSLREKSTFTIEARVPHSLDFLEDSIILGITIPENDDFPKGSNHGLEQT